MGKIKCYSFWIMLFLYTLISLILSPLYIIISVLFLRNPHKAMRKGIYYYARFFIKLVRPILPLRIENADIARQNSPCIIVANHQSFLDIYYIAAQNSSNLCLVVGSWPFRKFPFFAPLMRFAGYIEAGKKDGQNFIANCKALLANGCTILCFPEGHRGKNASMQKFYSGIFRVAIEANVPIIPMIFYNTGEVCPPRKITIKSQEIRIKILDAVYPDEVKFSDKPHIALKNIVFNHMQCTLDLKS